MKAAFEEYARRVSEGNRTPQGADYAAIRFEVRTEYGLTDAEMRETIIKHTITEAN